LREIVVLSLEILKVAGAFNEGYRACCNATKGIVVNLKVCNIRKYEQRTISAEGIVVNPKDCNIRKYEQRTISAEGIVVNPKGCNSRKYE
jgi:hypothetical protein